MIRKYIRHQRASASSLIGWAVCLTSTLGGQSFTSGSTGADGALNLTTPGVVNFDPKTFNPPLNPAGDNVFNFTTINIASGVVLKLSGRTFNSPVYFLAQGAVKIDGGIDLNGENGHPTTNIASERLPSVPGPGGYAGGVGGIANSNRPPSAGGGPGGGAAGNPQGGNGTFTASTYLLPLLGGSGGGGGGHATCGGVSADGGGAGGGAILIASSVSIAFTRNVATDGIFANGGTHGGCGSSGYGSGGAIRLVAPVISGNSLLQVLGPGNPGLVRLEANQMTYTGVNGPSVVSLPFKIITPTTQGQPMIQVSSINGVPINANPFSFPDITVNSSSPIVVNVTAQNIPVGTVPKVFIYSEVGPDQTVNCSALQGSLQQSTCTASITFPTGGSRGFVKANW